jgi:uncharacterized phage protein (TIGR02218 family)
MLTAHLADPVTHLAYLWQLTRRDGVRLGFTSHDRDLTVAGLRYRAAPSFVPSAIRTTAGFDIDTLELSGALSHPALTQADLAAGRWDGAQVRVLLVDWQDTALGTLELACGRLGEVRSHDHGFAADVRGLTDQLQAPALELCQATCRADLGDARCTVNLRRFRVLTTITAVVEPDILALAGINPTANWYAGGSVRWLSGANAGLDQLVLGSAGAQITLRTRPAAPIAVGDRLWLTAGCDKRYDTCRTKFDNGRNFQGEPFVPGVDSLVRYPGV